MDRNSDSDFVPDWVSPPGETILDLVEERDWSQAELASRLGISAKHLNQLIKGKVALTFETAIRLERVLGSTVGFWISRESRYREHLARIESERTYERWVSWLDSLPLDDLKRVGVIPNERLTAARKPKIVETLLTFFGVASPDEWSSHYASMKASFRRTKEEQADVGAIAAWLRLGEKVAEGITAPKYNRTKFERAVRSIRECTRLEASEFQPILVNRCLEAGVKVVFVQYIKKAHVSGVARWLNNHSPVIQMSLYGKTNDKFWFTFFHEAAHILLHSGEKEAIFLDDIDFPQTSAEEKEANEWARDLLIPPSEKFELVGLRFDDEIAAFADRLNIHPGIVVGRLQHEGQVHYGTPLNRLKVSLDVQGNSISSATGRRSE